MFQEPKPAPPPITETERYLTWFAQYSDEMEHVRCFYQQNTAAFALVCARDAMKELANYQDGDLLFES